MLIGQYKHSIDSKGRLSVPVKFREDLGSCFYVTKGLDGCLFVLSSGQWQNLQTKISSMPISKSRSLQRFFFSGASELMPDKQGRILIPQHLREYANIIKDATFIGASDRAEIWNSTKWENFSTNMKDSAVLEAMNELGV